MDVKLLNTKLANTLIGTENVIWDKHFTGQNLPKISDNVAVITYEPVGESNDNITWKWYPSHRYIKSIYISHYENIERITLYDNGHKMDSIHKWMLPVLKTLYDQHDNRLPFDQVMGDNYLISTTSCIVVEFDKAIEDCSLTYFYYDVDVPIMMPQYFWYASSIELEKQTLVISDVELQKQGPIITEYYMKVNLNINHPIYCLYWHSPAVITSVRLDVNEEILYYTDKIEKVGSCYVLPLHINTELQSYRLDKVPLNASQAEIVTLYLYFDNSGVELPTTIDIAAVAYHNMITSSLSAQLTKPGIGDSSLLSLTTGADNITIGLTTDDNNIAIGYSTSQQITTGSNKVAIGYLGLTNDISVPGSNVLIGYSATSAITTGSNKVAIGYQALTNDMLVPESKVSIGNSILIQNTTGGNKTAIGYQALVNSVNINDLVAIGFDALTPSNNDVATMYQKLTDGNGSGIGIGLHALQQGIDYGQ